MDDDRVHDNARKQRWYRKRNRVDNPDQEEDSDQSDVESDDSSVQDTPSKRTCHRSSSESSNADDQRESGDSSHSTVQRDSEDEQQIDSSPNQSIGSDIGSERNDNNGSNSSVNEGDRFMDGNDNPEDDINEHVAYDHVGDEPEDVGQHPNLLVNSPAASLSDSSEQSEASESSDESEDDALPGSERESESEEEREEVEDEDLNNRPLYDGAQITFQESMLAILTFMLSHKLTGLCLNDLLSLIVLHCGPNNICVKTLHKFKKYFSMVGKKFIKCHYYCSGCEIALDGKDSICNACEGQNGVAYFIEFPIVTQLQIMFKRPGFYECLMFRFNRVKKIDENIEDVYDGMIYKQQVENGFLANPNNLSFFMYFDGISLFKSSLFSIWPVYFTINELKYKLRTKKENTVLAGIWFGKSKPNPNLFLVPFQEQLSKLENEGANLSLPNDEIVLVKIKLLGAVGDMPAKSTFMRLKQYNGAYSCFNCMERGARHDLGNATIQVFPYNRNFQLRNNEETIEFGQLAAVARETDQDSSVYGVKGPSLLSIMLPNLILCMAIDIMHGIFLGIMKTLASLWFDTHYSGSPFSISGFVNVVDERLKKIKPPASFPRIPRLSKEFAQFKASDWKIFFFSIQYLY